MKNKIRRLYNSTTLATKIRYSYFMLLVPIVFFVIFCFYHLWTGNRQYADMINSAVLAGEFSLDFKKDYDYEAYLLIVENKSVEESGMDEMLHEANRIVNGLVKLTESEENAHRLENVKKYLDNLEIYKERIVNNLTEGNKYEDNIEIWENDIQIVTSLLREEIFRYLYYEIREMQQSRTEYQDFFVTMISISLIAFGGIVVLIILLSYYIPLSITRPIRKLSEITDQVARGDLTVRSDVRSGMEVSVLNDSLNTMIDQMNVLIDQVKKEQIRLRKAEFELLQAQINPHFLYNTLDAIVWLAEAGDQEKVVSMVENLSDFFRTSLNQGKDIISLEEELQHVRSYLEIQQVRYQDILQYEINVPKELEIHMIPKITIQPLVENALYHGIKNKRGLGKIVVTGDECENGLVIKITDNGIGMSEQRLKQVCDGIRLKGPSENDIYGLYNVNERIRLNFGEKYGITIESTYMEGTTVSVFLPTAEKN